MCCELYISEKAREIFDEELNLFREKIRTMLDIELVNLCEAKKEQTIEDLEESINFAESGEKTIDEMVEEQLDRFAEEEGKVKKRLITTKVVNSRKNERI